MERWLEQVDKTDTCWNWTGAKQAGGYGRFNLGGRGGKIVLVHRWTYEQFVGPIPEGLTIDHLCRNTACVNVAHMEVVTREVNAWRGNPNKDKTHCIEGHELTPENVYVAPGRPTARDCIACRKARRKARYVRDKEARAA
jgi:hypothetical protein